MDIVILRTNGVPVKLSSAFPENKRRFDVNGFLIGFTFISIVDNQSTTIEYKYFQSSDFLKEDVKNNISLEGYYIEAQFLKYINVTAGIKFSNLKKFPFEKYVAKAGEEISVKVVDYGKPYNLYYKSMIFTFDLEMSADGKSVKHYKKFDFKNLVQDEIAIPDNVKSKTPLPANREGYPDFYFYDLNFSEYNDNVFDHDRLNAYNKKLVTLITFKIWYIVRDIFPKLVNLTKVDSIADSLDGGYGVLSNLEIIVFLLKKNWCFYYDPNSQLKHREKPPKTLFAMTIDETGAYYNALNSFYTLIYKNKATELSNGPKTLFFLLRFLPQESLNLVPYPPLKNIVENFASLEKLDEELQQILVRVIIAVTEKYDNANDFLVFLLSESSKVGDDKKKMTYFQNLYYLLDDARLERLTIVNWFVTEQDNRKYFAYAIFKMWKFSKYDWDFYSVGVPHPDMDSNYVSSYWDNNNEFNNNNTIEFVKGSVVKPEENSKRINVGVDFKSKIDNVNISIDLATEKGVWVGTVYKQPIYRPLGSFHLYQPVSLLNYDGNADLKLPQKIIFPAFLVFFIKEYDELADFDALMSLTIDIGVDIALFYALGGAGVIRDLTYLKYTTKIGRGLLGLLPETEMVTVWKGVATASQVVSLTAGQLMLVNSYLIKTENDPLKRILLEKTQKTLFWSMLASTGISIYSSYKAVSTAAEAYRIYKSNESTFNLDDATKSLLDQFYGQEGMKIADFGQKLQDLKAQGKVGDNLIDWFHNADILTDELRLKFISQFETQIEAIAQSAKGNIHSSEIVSTLNRWKYFVTEGLPDAQELSVILDGKLSLSYYRYFNSSADPIGEYLYNLKSADRQQLLRIFSDVDDTVFDLIKADPERMVHLAGLDVQKLNLIRQNDYLWAKCDFVYEQIIDVQKSLLLNGLVKIGESKPYGFSLLKEPILKNKAIEFLTDGNKWSNGKFFEEANKEILLKNIANDEDIYLSVDIVFFNSKGIRISDPVQEIDGLRFNKTSKKIETIISIKLNMDKHKPGKDTKKLIEYLFNCPDNGASLKQYIVGELKLGHVSKYDDVVEAKIFYVDLKTGKEVFIPPSIFKQGIKENFDYSIDYFEKIHPESIGTTKKDLIEGVYHSLKNNKK